MGEREIKRDRERQRYKERQGEREGFKGDCDFGAGLVLREASQISGEEPDPGISSALIRSRGKECHGNGVRASWITVSLRTAHGDHCAFLTPGQFEIFHNTKHFKMISGLLGLIPGLMSRMEGNLSSSWRPAQRH